MNSRGPTNFITWSFFLGVQELDFVRMWFVLTDLKKRKKKKTKICMCFICEMGAVWSVDDYPGGIVVVETTELLSDWNQEVFVGGFL